MIIELESEGQLVTTHFSPLSGQDDAPENYHAPTWSLEGGPDTSLLTLTQDNNATAEVAGRE